MIKRLLDSVILIDHLNGIRKASQYILGLTAHETAISVISRAEILSGVETKDEGEVRALLNQFPVFIIDRMIADLAASLRKKNKWKLPDAFQAALCLHHGVKLITRNTRDFNPKKHPFVEIPYSLS